MSNSSRVEITVTENGPYKVNGPIELTDHEGRAIELPGETVFLCRCGGSSKKPFCDGTHSKIGFQDTPRAAEQTEPPEPA